MPPGALTGLIPACHTPFDHRGELKLSTVDQQATLFRETGLHSVFIAGTTGEFASLTVAERKALCDRWMDVAGDSMRVAVHVGHNCLADALDLAAHARRAGGRRGGPRPPQLFQARDHSRPGRFLCDRRGGSRPAPLLLLSHSGDDGRAAADGRVLVRGPIFAFPTSRDSSSRTMISSIYKGASPLKREPSTFLTASTRHSLLVFAWGCAGPSARRIISPAATS